MYEVFKNRDVFNVEPHDYRRLLVVSLGTGAAKVQPKYSSKKAAKWGILGWLFYGCSSPLLDMCMHSRTETVDDRVSADFQFTHSEDNYLRIQVSLQFTIYISN